MAVLLLAQRLAEHGQDGSRSSAGFFIGQPGTPAHLPDEVVEPDRVCLLVATPPCLQLLCQAGEICGKASRLAIAELIREPLQYRPGDIRRFLARQSGSLRYRTDECLVVHGHGSLRRLTGQYRGQLDLASAWGDLSQGGHGNAAGLAGRLWSSPWKLSCIGLRSLLAIWSSRE